MPIIKPDCRYECANSRSDEFCSPVPAFIVNGASILIVFQLPIGSCVVVTHVETAL